MTKIYDLAGKRVWVAGHSGMVGSALVRRLAGTGAEILTVARDSLDLRRQSAVESWFAANRPDAVFLAAGTVGGIEANRTRPSDFLYDNLAISANIIHAAAQTGVCKLLFLGSSCFYPRETTQPVTEAALLTGPLEPTNEAFAIAKIASAKLCQAYRRQHKNDFIVAVPTNLFGPGDNFSLTDGHVIPSLLRKVEEARESGAECVDIWGTGEPVREFLYVDDAADALVFLMEHYSEDSMINVAGGEAVRIRELAQCIAEIVGYSGRFHFDTSKPDGMPRKALDSSRIRAAGWRPSTSLREGLARTWRWFLATPRKEGVDSHR